MTTDPQALVEKFFDSPFKFAMASKLRDLGPEVSPYLRAALEEGRRDAATLRQCAAILLHFGDRFGVEYLLRDLVSEGGDAPFSALRLAEAGVEEARGLIAGLLAGDIMQRLPNEAFVLIDAHQRFGKIEAELREHLLGQVPEKLRGDLVKVLAK